jgi:DNA-binding response OmpR family regulator
MTERNAPVLIVEDDDSLRSVLAAYLRRKGFEVTEAHSAEDAVDALRRGLRPRLVVLDINLPGASGWELLRRPDLFDAGSPPVIITSSAAVNPRRLREFSVADFLPKPFALEAFLATVERLAGAAAAP